MTLNKEYYFKNNFTRLAPRGRVIPEKPTGPQTHLNTVIPRLTKIIRS